VVITSSNSNSLNIAVSGIIYAVPAVNNISPQIVTNGSITTPVSFSGTANVYTWLNNMPGIGLPGSGTGNIPLFTAVNNGSTPVVATITVTPIIAGLAYIPNTASNNVSVINTVSNTVIATIPVGKNPHGIAAGPGGNYVYIANGLSNTVSVVNTTTNTVMATVPVGNNPETIAASGSGGSVYVANAVDGTVSVINTATNTITAIITLGGTLNSIAVSPDGSHLYVSDLSTDNIAVINTATNSVIANIALDGDPTDIATSPDGNFVYVTNGNSVSVITAATNIVTATIGVGTIPTSLAVSPEGDYIYTANSGASTVSVISTASQAVVATVTAGTQPYGISVDPANGAVYVTNASSNNVSVINAATNTVVATIPVGTSPQSAGNFITPGSPCSGEPFSFTIKVQPSPAQAAAITETGTLSQLSTTYGTPSLPASFSVGGANLTGGISIMPPAGFEVSTDNITFSGVVTTGGPGTTASITIYVRIAAVTPVGTYQGSIVLSSTGATSIDVMVSGTVSPAPLIITADNKTKFYETQNPDLTATYTGFENKENASDLTTQPTLTTTAITTSPIGEYPISASGAASPNYTITYVNGTLTITVAPPQITIPNTFTPNGDGINDTWDIKNIDGYPNCTVNIYNRWGAKVFSSIGYGKPWDGRYNGGNLPVGTYYYIIDLKNSSKALASFVTIIR
jgi:gliding motility-associated-like protein